MATTLNKPMGLPVFPPHDDAAGACALATLLADQPWRRDIVWPVGFEGGIAHRLDNDTSGALLVADDLDELARLRQWFTAHVLTKTYLLLAAKDVPWDRNVCDAPIASHKTKKAVVIVQRGRNTPHRGKWYPARTRFERVVKGRNLFRAIIQTGMRHQIRAHAAFVGIPILGDKRYGGGDGTMHLHHVGLEGPNGFKTSPVPAPAWTT